MTDAIITGPGLYVLRNGDFVAIVSKWFGGWRSVERTHRWDKDGRSPYLSSMDIIRRATPEEAARFCGLTHAPQET